MPSKGTYDARKYENKRHKKPEKGIFSIAAKKLRNVFTSSALTKSKTYRANDALNRRKTMPNWHDDFNYNYYDYSSSSDSSDEEEFEAIHRQRSHSSSSRRNYQAERHDAWHPHNATSNRPLSASITASKKTGDSKRPLSQNLDTGAQDVTTGFATVRKLKTASSTQELVKNGHKKASIVRSSSFSQGDRHYGINARLKHLPVDLIEESDDDEAFCEDSHQLDNVIEIDVGKTQQPFQSTPNVDMNSRKNDNNAWIVVQDFVTTDEKDLNVYSGQKVHVLNKSNTNLWLVESENGKAGFVPCGILMPTTTVDHSIAAQPRVPTINHLLLETSIEKDKTALSSVKLARISPTVRQNNSSCLQDDDVSFEKKILDLKRAMQTQMIAFERCKEGKSDSVINEEDIQKSNLLEASLPELLEDDRKSEALTGTDNCHQPCNVYITSKPRRENSKTQTCATENVKLLETNDPKLPSYDQLMSKRQDPQEPIKNKTELGKLELGQSIYDTATTAANCKTNDRESNMINSLITEFEREQKKFSSDSPCDFTTFKQQQKRPNNDSLSSPRDYATVELASACDSSSQTSQTSYDSTEPMPRALRRRNSMSKKVRFQTPETDQVSSKNVISTHNYLTVCKNDILATWM